MVNTHHCRHHTHQSGGGAQNGFSVDPGVNEIGCERRLSQRVENPYACSVCQDEQQKCFYCKHNLYETIQQRTDVTVVSGANLDDLGDYRPGLDAARVSRWSVLVLRESQSGLP